MRKIIALLLSLMLIVSSMPAMAEEAAAVKTGLSFVADLSSSKDGTAQANIALTAVNVDDNGVITACVIDAIQGKISFDETGKLTTDKATEFKSKNELGDAYGMRGASSISKEWNEQAAAFAAYCVGKTVEELKAMELTEDGKPADADLAAGCTLAAYNFLPGVEDAVNKAAHLGAKEGDTLKLVHTSNAASSKDATAEADGQAQVYTTVAVVSFDEDVITACYIDAVQATVKFNAEGKITSDVTAAVQTKNEKGDAYGMRGASSISKEWNEQAAGFAAYVTGKTLADVAGIAVENGKATDADLAAVITLSLGDFQALLAKAAE